MRIPDKYHHDQDHHKGNGNLSLLYPVSDVNYVRAEALSRNAVETTRG